MTAETDRRARRAGLAPVSVKDILASARSTDSASASAARSMMFTRSVPVEAEIVRSDRTGRTVEAYAAVFMTPTEIVDQDGHYREQNAPDAFNKSVAERKGQIFCVYNHARALGGMPSDTWSVPLGEVLWIRADSRGLLTATRYSDDPDSDRILTAIRNKALKGMSYTGVFLRSTPELRGPYDEYMPDQDGELVLVTRQEIALIEFGPTPIPAYETAQVIGVRSRRPASTGDGDGKTGEEDLTDGGVLSFPGSEDIQHPIVPPDDPTSIAMWTAHRTNSMAARLAHGRERLKAARDAKNKTVRDDNALQLRNHLAAAIKHGLMLVESVKVHYPDEAKEYEAVVRTQGLKLRSSPAPKSTFAHLLQTSLYQMAHAKRHADLLTDDADDTFEFDADHASNHVDGAIEHVAKFAQNLRDNYPTESQWLSELTGKYDAAEPAAAAAQRTDPSVKANVVSSNPDGPAPYWKRDADTILCPNCGLYADTGSEYCDQCGEGLGDGASPSSVGMSASGKRGPQFKDGLLLVISSGNDQELPVTDDDTVQCPSCGQMNGCDAIFCRRCGASIPSSAYAAALNGANPPTAAKSNQSASGGKGMPVQTSSSGREGEEGQERSTMGDEQERAAGGPAATGTAGMPTLDHADYRGHHTHAHYAHGGPDEDGDGIHSHGHTHDSGTSHDHGHGSHIRDYVMSSGEDRDPELQDTSDRQDSSGQDASERQYGMLPPLLHDLYDGDHTHPHDANGEMDDDGNGVHEHSHSHTGDRGHAHSHEEFIGVKPATAHPASGIKGGGGKQATLKPSKPKAGPPKTGDATGSSGREDTSDEHERAGSVDNSTWDGPAAMSRALHAESPASAFSSICAGRRSGDPKLQATWALPHHKTPGGPPNAAGVRNALARLSGTQGLTNKSAAQKHLEGHMTAIQGSSNGGDGGKKGSSSSGRDPVAAGATSREAGHGTGPAAGYAEPHSHPAPHVRSGESQMGASDDRMTIAERMQRQQDVKNRLFEIDEEYMGSELPYDRQQEWKALQSELVIHQRAIEDASARAEYLQRVGTEDATGFNPGLAERVDDAQAGYGERDAAPIPSGRGAQGGNGWKGMAGSSGPQLLSRMNPVYDLTAIRNRARSIDEVPTLYREYASRAIEAARFPGVSNREQAQTNVQRLIDSIDDEMGTLSRRILVTGSPLYERSFGKMVKALSQNGLTTEESRALQLGVDAAGGFAVPFQLDPTVILTYNGVINPLRQISRVEQITGKEWDGVTSTGIVISRASEGQEASDNSPALVAPTVRTTRVQGFVPFSIELDMSWGSMRNQMTQMLADAKDIEEASSFTLGSGGAPNCNGLITTLATAAPANASVQVLTATTAVVAVGDIYNMESNAAPKFRQTSSWLASKTTYNRIRQLFQQFAALAGDPWVRALPGQPAELLGYPAFEASVMSNSIASGQFPLVFGDFSQFLIVDRVGMGIELIPHLFGATNRFPTGQRGLFAIWFNNCQTLAPNAFRILQMR